MRRTRGAGAENPFEETAAAEKVMRQSSTSLMKEAQQVRESYKEAELERDLDIEEEAKDTVDPNRYQALLDRIKD